MPLIGLLINVCHVGDDFSGADNDLEYYVRECGDVLGVIPKLAEDQRSGKHILEYIFAQIVEFKKSSRVSCY